MKIFSKRYVLISIIMFFICIGIGSVLIINNTSKKRDILINGGPDNEGGFSYNADGTVTLGLGMVSHGFFNSKKGKILDQGSLLKPIGGRIRGTISFSQNIPDLRNYLLIIMVDYVQQQFSVDGNNYFTYPFSLEGNDSTWINVEVPLAGEDYKEFEYLIIREPEMRNFSIDNENEWKKLLMTSEIYTWRLPLISTLDNNPNLEYDNTFIKIDDQGRLLGSGINLTRTYQDMMVLPSCNSMETIEMVLGNESEEYSNYVLIAFLNWRQVPFDDENNVKYVNIPPKTCIYNKIIAPNVDTDTPYQIFAFPKPFNEEFRYSAPPMSTLRTIIKTSINLD